MSFALALACVAARALAKQEKLELKRGDCSVVWNGDTVNLDHDFAESLITALQDIEVAEKKTQQADSSNFQSAAGSMEVDDP